MVRTGPPKAKSRNGGFIKCGMSTFLCLLNYKCCCMNSLETEMAGNVTLCRTTTVLQMMLDRYNAHRVTDVAMIH